MVDSFKAFMQKNQEIVRIKISFGSFSCSNMNHVNVLAITIGGSVAAAAASDWKM